MTRIDETTQPQTTHHKTEKEIRAANRCGDPACECASETGNIHCPAHADANPSLSVTTRNGKVLLKCFAGCNQESVMAAINNGTANGHAPSRKANTQPKPKRLTIEQADTQLSARGLTSETIARFQIEANATRQGWSYPVIAKDEVQAIRWKNFDSKSNPKYWWSKEDARRYFVYGTENIPTGIEELYLVAGEPDVWIMQQTGFATVAFLGGEGTVKPEYFAVLLELFPNLKRLIVIYDDDEAGRKGAAKAEKIGRENGLSVQILNLAIHNADNKKGFDLSDLYADRKFDPNIFKADINNLGSDTREPQHEVTAQGMTPTQTRQAFKKAAREYSEPLTLAEVIAHFRKWLYLEDEGLLEVYLGTIAANLMDGDPVWLMIVGASGGGKTEPLNAAIRLPFVHLAATVTESSLLSGTPKREKSKTAKGGLLREVGGFGFLLLKDFTSMLSQRRDASAAVLSAFREIYDGSWTRHVGSDGGTVLHWSGKLAVIAGCTDTIDSHTAVIGTMGERFAFYRLPELKDARKLSRHALNMAGKEAAMRDELSRAVCGLFAGVKLPDAPPEISEAELERLIDLASLAARCRSAVERDNHSRDITLTLSPEAPTRIAKILRQLMHGMDAIGVPRERIWTALEKVAFDSMHKVRRVVIETLLDGQLQATSNIAKSIQYPTSTARRALEELYAHGVVDCEKGGAGKSDSWQLSEWTRCTLKAIKAPNQIQNTTFPVFQTDDISFSSLEEDEDINNGCKLPAKYLCPEKRERSETKPQVVEL